MNFRDFQLLQGQKQESGPRADDAPGVPCNPFSDGGPGIPEKVLAFEQDLLESEDPYPFWTVRIRDAEHSVHAVLAATSECFDVRMDALC